MFQVVLESFPADRHEHIVRVALKHNRSLSHHDHEMLVAKVHVGQPQVIATTVEAENARNVVAEIVYHGGKARIDADGESAS